MRTALWVFTGGEWCKVKWGLALASGWLDYELSDGTRGLMRPGKWREAPAKPTDKPTQVTKGGAQ